MPGANDVLKEVTEIYKDVLDNNSIVLSMNTTAADIEEWDSLTHVQLVVAIEKHFGLRFLSSEIRQWKNVGEMVELIIQKQQKA